MIRECPHFFKEAVFRGRRGFLLPPRIYHYSKDTVQCREQSQINRINWKSPPRSSPSRDRWAPGQPDKSTECHRMLYKPAWWADTCLGHKARPAQLLDRSLASAQPHPQPQTSWRAIRQLLLLRQSRADAQTLNNPGPAAELCIISDRLARLQDANQPQIKSSSKLMSHHILSVQLHSVTLCATGREQEEPCTAAAPAPGPNSAPQICLFSCQGDQCGHAQLPEHRGVFLSYQGAALFSMEKHQPSPKHQGFNWTIKDAANNHEGQQLTETR